MSIDDDIAVLEKVPMLRALGRSALRLIAMGAETRRIAAGEVLFKPQDVPDCAYVVQEGSFRLAADPARATRPLTAGPGMMLGEFALMTGEARPLSATALEPSTVMRISRSMFTKILEEDADAAVRLYDYAARCTRQSVADMLRVRDALEPKREQ